MTHAPLANHHRHTGAIQTSPRTEDLPERRCLRCCTMIGFNVSNHDWRSRPHNLPGSCISSNHAMFICGFVTLDGCATAEEIRPGRIRMAIGALAIIISLRQGPWPLLYVKRLRRASACSSPSVCDRVKFFFNCFVSCGSLIDHTYYCPSLKSLIDHIHCCQF